MFKKSKIKYIDDSIAFEPGVINLLKHVEYKKKFVVMKLNEDDLGYLKMFKPFAKDVIDDAVADFYKGIVIESNLMDIIKAHSSIERLSKTLKIHLLSMFEGKIDDAYVEARLRVSNTHVRIGLETNWYMMAFQLVFNVITDRLESSQFSVDYLNKLKLAILKLLNFEQQIVLQAYEEKRRLIAREDEKAKWENKLIESSNDIIGLTNEAMGQYRELLKEATYIVDISEKVKLITDECDKLSKQSEKHLDNLISQLLVIKSSLNNTLTNLKELEQLNDNVFGIVSIVDKIADQTNLLSLNASIEAARAGDLGRGFDVVAKEVRKLSDKTKVSTEDIRGTIKDLESQLKLVLVSIEELVIAVRGEETELEIVTNQFKEINLKTEEISTKYVEVMDSILKMNESLISIEKNLNRSVDEINLLTTLFDD